MSRSARAFLAAALLALGLAASPDLAPAASAQQAVPASLDAAYQKEYAYLQAEKAALTARLQEVQAQSRSRVGAAEAELNGREARLRSLVSSTERTEEVLVELERAADNASERADRLETTLGQATTSLELTPIPESLKESEDPGAYAAAQGQLLRQAFTGVAEQIRTASTVRVEPGTFFLPDGSQVEGELLRVGQVAAYGRSGQTYGALLPAGSDRLKVRAEGDGGTAEALFAGKQPASLGVFLFEDLRQEVVERQEKGALETVEAGGSIAWVIVGLGAVGVVLAFIRLLLITRAGMGAGAADKVLAAVKSGDKEAALGLVAKGRTPTQRVLAAVLRLETDDREALESVAAEAVLREQPTLNAFGTHIMVVAAVAPLLGLLGTVTGMIATFDIITEYGTGDPRMLSGGISEALITTELGLVVAIPTLLLGNLLSSRGRSILDRLERGALEVVNRCAA